MRLEDNDGGRKMARAGNVVGFWVAILLLVGSLVNAQSLQDECAVELYDKIFKPSLGQMKTPHALVEFVASWLPTCQQYKPHFERVACLFNHPHAVHENEVFVTKVDCGIESNKHLCDRFNVQSYPTMYLGPPEILASGNGFSKAKLGLESVEGDAVSTADELLQWINKRINKQYSLTDRRPEVQNNVITKEIEASAWPPGLWQLPGTLRDVEEATAYAFSYMMDERIMRSSSRASFIQFMHLLERHHPSERCRKGSAKVLQNLEEWWPLRQAPANILREQQLCGPGLPRGFWVTCDGEGRGYSCGLWLLLHSLTVDVEDFEGTFAISAIDAFVDDFYKCDHCREHFRNSTARKSLDSTLSKKDVVLWLWRTHNKVTEDIAREELEVKGKSSKNLWPLEKECPACRDSAGDILDWDDEAVYYFIVDFYKPLRQGGGLVTNQRSELVTFEKSLGVPYWAAAVVSCGFTFATLYLRSCTQKSKYLPRRV